MSIPVAPHPHQHFVLLDHNGGECFFFINLFIYFLVVLDRRFCARTFSSCGERGPPFIVVRGPLTIAASPIAEHRLQTRRPSNCGSRAQLPRGTRDPPRPGLEPVSPALAGRLPTTAPPVKPWRVFLNFQVLNIILTIFVMCTFIISYLSN